MYWGVNSPLDVYVRECDCEDLELWTSRLPFHEPLNFYDPPVFVFFLMMWVFFGGVVEVEIVRD